MVSGLVTSPLDQPLISSPDASTILIDSKSISSFILTLDLFHQVPSRFRPFAVPGLRKLFLRLMPAHVHGRVLKFLPLLAQLFLLRQFWLLESGHLKTDYLIL